MCIQSPHFLDDYPGLSHISDEGNTSLQSTDKQLTEIWARRNPFCFYCFLRIKKKNILINKYLTSPITEGKCTPAPNHAKHVQGHMTLQTLSHKNKNLHLMSVMGTKFHCYLSTRVPWETWVSPTLAGQTEGVSDDAKVMETYQPAYAA